MYTAQKAQEQFGFSPIAGFDVLLGCLPDALQDLCCKLRFLSIEYQYDGRYEGDLQGLLNGPVGRSLVLRATAAAAAHSQLHDKLKESSGDITVEVILCQSLRNTADLFFHSANRLRHALVWTRLSGTLSHYRFCDGQDLLS